MAFQNIAYQVMLASPSDLVDERAMFSEVTMRFNRLHGEHDQVMLQPLLWEKDATPRSNIRPQDAIKHELVDKCDILVALFWTKLGEPTIYAESGTAEEIEDVIKAGKDVLIYFSDVPVRPSQVNLAQMVRLDEHKSKLFKENLTGRYASLSEFAQKVGDDLLKTVRRIKGKNVVALQRTTRPETEEEDSQFNIASDRAESIHNQFLERLDDGQFYSVKRDRCVFGLSIVPVKRLARRLTLNMQQLEANADGYCMGRIEPDPIVRGGKSWARKGIDYPNMTTMQEDCNFATELSVEGELFAAMLWQTPRPPHYPPSRWPVDMSVFQPILVKSIYKYLSLLRSVGVGGPWFLTFSLMNAHQTVLVPSLSDITPPTALTPLADSVATIDPHPIDASFDPSDEEAYFQMLRPALDQFWHNWNYPGARGYDDDSNRYVGL